MARRRYPSDLTDREWRVLAPLLPEVYDPSPRTGRPRVHSYREIMDGVFYVLRSGCSWRMMPKDLPPWQSVYYYFRNWRLDGTWERVHQELRENARVQVGRDPTPSGAIIDSQSVRTSEKGG